MTTTETREERRAAAERILAGYIKVGDLITHTRCMGIIEEHRYTGRDGQWLCGEPTADTVRFGGSSISINDISPLNVTHINRVPLDVVPMLAARQVKTKLPQAMKART